MSFSCSRPRQRRRSSRTTAASRLAWRSGSRPPTARAARTSASESGRPSARSRPRSEAEDRMLRRIRDMPSGTLGFEAVGKVEDDDWEDAVEPVLRSEIAEGEKLRLLYLLGPEARVEGEAMSADTGFRARYAKSFDRVAVVSDEDWIRPALRALSFLLPGKAKGFAVRDLEGAKSWLADESK